MPTLAALLNQADPAGGRPLPEAAQAARLALALAQELGRAGDASQAAAWLSTSLFRQGLHVELLAHTQAALPWLEATGRLDDIGEVMRLAVLGACETGRFAEALETSRRFSAQAAAAGDGGWSLMAAYTLGAVFDRMGDPWQAMRLLDEALQTHARAATPRQQLIARIGVCAFLGDAFHRVRDAVPVEERREFLIRAQPHGEAAVVLSEQVGEPLFELAARNNLGELLLLLGSPDAAEPLLVQARRLAEEHGLTAYRWRAEATWGEWLLARGRPSEALVLAEAVLHEMADRAPQATAIRVRDVAFKACRDQGRWHEALEHLIAFERLERHRTLSEIRAQAELFVTRIENEAAQSLAARAQAEATRESARAREFAHHAEHDVLTGLGNRRLLVRRVAELATTAATAQPGAAAGHTLALIDIDHFKRINDDHGHAAGDAVLGELAHLLRERTRGADILVRLGGEEFAIVFMNTSSQAALEVCERLRSSVEQRNRWPELPETTRLSISIGIASHPMHGSNAAEQSAPPGAAGPSVDLDGWLRRVDEALYEAKRRGRNRVQVAGTTKP